MSISGWLTLPRSIGLLLVSCIATSGHAQIDVLAMLQDDSSGIHSPSSSGDATAREVISETGPTDGSEPYGRAGSVEWTVGGMVCAEFGITELAMIRNEVDWFVRDRFSIGLQLDVGGAWVGGGGYTGTVGGATVARWHFLHRETWTLFADVGIGLAWFGSPLPEGGTRLNFSPQAGLGATFRIDDRLRLHVSAGWYHLSNARTSNSNPGFDGLAVQVGIGIAF